MTEALTYQTNATKLANDLWAVANDLRGQVDSSRFKDYILVIIFYKYLSERTEEYVNDTLLKNENLTYEEAFENPAYKAIIERRCLEKLGYTIEPKYLFSSLVEKAIDDKFSVEDLIEALANLKSSTQDQVSADTFDGLFDSINLRSKDLGNTPADRTKRISNVIQRIAQVNFDAKDDVLGTAYMILISNFASDAGKKGGEFFTPSQVARLCAKLATVGLDEVRTAGDCTCGSASMLLEVQNQVPTHEVGHFYGQENNYSNYNLARMNMLIHRIDPARFDLYNDDTLINDRYKEDEEDLKIQVQVCNPPYSLHWSGNKALLSDPRYKDAGKLPSKTKADMLFLEHMVHHMDEDDGRIAVLMPLGVLFREGAEKEIRKWLIETKNCIDAIIALPSNLFYGTSIPVCILVLKSTRNPNSDNILFIDASKEFEKGTNQNTLDDAHIQKIVDAYIAREDIDKFAHVAHLQEIRENDYNLNIPRYVDTSEPEELIDVDSVWQGIESVQQTKTDAISAIKSMSNLLS